jgi:hypothetical protein
MFNFYNFAPQCLFLVYVFSIVIYLEFIPHVHLKPIFRYIYSFILHKVDTSASKPIYLYSVVVGRAQLESQPYWLLL